MAPTPSSRSACRPTTCCTSPASTPRTAASTTTRSSTCSPAATTSAGPAWAPPSRSSVRTWRSFTTSPRSPRRCTWASTPTAASTPTGWSTRSRSSHRSATTAIRWPATAPATRSSTVRAGCCRASPVVAGVRATPAWCRAAMPASTPSPLRAPAAPSRGIGSATPTA